MRCCSLKIIVPVAFALVAIITYVIQPSANPSNFQYYKSIGKQIVQNMKRLGEFNRHNAGMKVLLPLPETDFDPSEAAVAWKIFTSVYNFTVQFASDRGEGTVFHADPVTLEGKGLDAWMRAIFDVFSLGTTSEVRRFYEEMSKSKSFTQPLAFRDLNMSQYDGVWLTGGHAPGIKQQYLENRELHRKMSEFWVLNRPTAAICHGVLVVARSKQLTNSKKSLLYGKRSTSLSNFQEKAAYLLTFWRLGSYYRTYPEITTEDEVKLAIYDAQTVEEANVKHVQLQLYDEGPLSFAKSSMENINKDGYFVEDGHYLSGRWPGDAHLLAHRFAQKILGL